ncbi:MAG TPA: phosphoenolpyruvate--protein phosphotransferase [Candidatus Binataceae bacterium]|nr:phosphoenolpyruvate--protein phosphotransferase [Candidatus Binataceae bacterium]
MATEGAKTRKDRLALIELLSSIASEYSDDLRETLDRLVGAIATGMEAEVCSLYQFDPQRERLVLRATVGLERDSVGKVSMRTDEGLVGLVLEKDAPLWVPDAMSHPRYKYFPETGEERFHTFLAVPVHDGRKRPMGVLVTQTLERRKVTKSEMTLLSTAANQVAQVMASYRLRETLATKEKERLEYRRRMIEANRQLKDYEKVGGKARLSTPQKIRRPRLVGLSASPGFALGQAHVVGTFLSTIDRNQRARDPKAECKRIDEALERSTSEIAALRERMAPLMPESDLKIFDAHRLILEDEAFTGRIREAIDSGYSAESALFRVIDELTASMLASADGYLRERAADFRDVGHRVLRHLHHEDKKGAFTKPTVIVADELTLSQLTMVSHEKLAGIALQSGGVTSHAAILARAFEIPTVVGVEHLMESVVEGDHLVLDGNSGVVYVNPGAQIESDYVGLAKRYEAFKKELIEESGEPAATSDGHRVMMLANIALLADIHMAIRYGAEGVGLLRSEFSFLTYEDFPDENQQLALYRQMLEAVGQRPVTIRTLDIGADKYPSYMRVPREDNPFLGWRSIRISLEMAGLFKIQLRAILRAASRYKVRVLFPMISSLEELRRAKEILAEAQAELFREGIEHNPNIEVGMMVEVPSAVWLAPRLSHEIDFFSIGTNDLIQYLLAADRNNPKVAHLYESLHPAVLSAIAEVVNVARAADKEVCLCGEMASDPLTTLLLVGMGLDELSLSPLFIPVVRKVIREVDYQTARQIARDSLQMASVQEIKGYLIERYRDLGLMNLVEMYR